MAVANGNSFAIVPDQQVACEAPIWRWVSADSRYQK
jgi:hypothetical protein